MLVLAMNSSVDITSAITVDVIVLVLQLLEKATFAARYFPPREIVTAAPKSKEIEIATELSHSVSLDFLDISRRLTVDSTVQDTFGSIWTSSSPATRDDTLQLSARADPFAGSDNVYMDPRI